MENLLFLLKCIKNKLTKEALPSSDGMYRTSVPISVTLYCISFHFFSFKRYSYQRRSLIQIILAALKFWGKNTHTLFIVIITIKYAIQTFTYKIMSNLVHHSVCSHPCYFLLIKFSCLYNYHYCDTKSRTMFRAALFYYHY